MTDTSSSGAGLGAPLWSSPFRPFFLLGAAYAPLMLGAWLIAFWGAVGPSWPPYPMLLWHGHEMVFGFAGAIVCGFVLTALPGWAGTTEIVRGPLLLLAAAWLLGRLAVWASPLLPPGVVMAVDSALFALVTILVSPGLLAGPNKCYLLLLPILAGLFLGNVLFHAGVSSGDLGGARFGVRLGVAALIFKLTLVGGFLTPVFTENHLRGAGWTGRITFLPWLETLAVATVLCFLIADLAAADPTWTGSAAALAGLLQAVRMARWQSFKAMRWPVVAVMHVAYGCFVLALGHRAVADLSGLVAPVPWLHVFTVGALGLMMVGLMTRVVLRHTGRALVPAPVMVLAFAMVLAGATLRLLAQGPVGLTASALLWGLAFIVYLLRYAPVLMGPSMAPPVGRDRAANAPGTTAARDQPVAPGGGSARTG